MPRAVKLAISSGTKVAICSVVVGIGGGYGAIGFRYLIHGSSVVFFEGTKGPLAWMGDYRIVALPALGALFVGLLTHFVAGESKGHGVPVVLEAVATSSVMRGRSCRHLATQSGCLPGKCFSP